MIFSADYFNHLLFRSKYSIALIAQIIKTIFIEIDQYVSSYIRLEYQG